MSTFIPSSAVGSANITDDSIVNADINSAAAIALSKLAATTASRAVVSDGSGFMVASAVTATELGYVSGVTSAIQTQLAARLPLVGGTLTGDITENKTTDLTLTLRTTATSKNKMIDFYSYSGSVDYQSARLSVDTSDDINVITTTNRYIRFKPNSVEMMRLSAVEGGMVLIGNQITTGNLTFNTAGGGVLVKEGSNATMGTLTLNGTTEVTVSTTKVTASSRIFLTIQAPGGTPAGIAYVSSRSAGASFGVKGIVSDTSTVAWLIIEPA